jgi:putative ABC transport system permease protein
MRIGSTALLGRIVGMPVGSQPAVDRVLVRSGTYLGAGAADGALVEQHAAAHFHLRAGDAVHVGAGAASRSVRVLGVAASPEYLWPARSRQDVLTSPDDFAVLFVPEALAREVGGPSADRQLLVYVPDRARADAVVTALRRSPDLRSAVEVTSRADQPSNAALQEDVQGFDELSLLFPILFLSAAAMAAWVLLTRLVTAQRSQIGTLRAFGAGRGTVVRHYVGFGLVAGLVGAIPGAIAGMLLAGLVTGAYTRAISVPVVVSPLHPSTALVGVALGLLVGAAAAAGPAVRASRIPPAEAMRGLVPSAAGGPSLIERVAPPLRRAPVAVRMMVRSMSRDRRRTLYTVLGVVLALVLVLVSWGLLDTTDVLLAKQFHDVQRQDAEVYLSVPVTPSQVARLSSVPGVAAAEPAAQLPVGIRGETGSYATSLMAFEPHTRMHGFALAGAHAGALPARGVVLGTALRSRLGVSVGDSVTLALPSLGASITERVAGFVAEPLGTFAYVSLPTLQAALGATLGAEANDTVADAVLLRFKAGTDPLAMRAKVSSLPGVAAYVDSRSLQRAARSFVSLFYAFVGLMLVFGAALAFVLVYNTMSVNVAERGTEVATLLSEGVGLRRVGTLIAGENVLVTVIGIVPGLIAGYLVADAFMSSFSSDLFRFDLAMRPTTFVWAALAMIAVALVVQWPAMRAVRRIDVAAILRERTG